ncbi:hypothetical protein [Polaribacter sp. Q13]|uniref:hypothetical protein n=1 Tax=Polaribacter sp. Q13 TaxID=2806551 RepID=UPI00193BCFA5|nr:hypothetical protein [Polaribacter sp. Q13]QVY66814.1 hypothetical protein JOP69_05900 [Polaribacter sp. Q13]
MNNKLFFHYLSYLQYPFLVGGLYFTFKSNSNGFNLQALNNMLIFMGLAISFASLQDTKKVSLKFDKKIWENPKLGKIFIRYLIIITLLIFVFGIFGYFISDNKNIKEVSFGIIIFGVGLIGMLKTGMEILENHIKNGKNKTDK